MVKLYVLLTLAVCVAVVSLTMASGLPPILH
jgi:hypothetical protein